MKDRARQFLIHAPADIFWPDEFAPTEAEAELRAKQIARTLEHIVVVLSPVGMDTCRGFPSVIFQGRRDLFTVGPCLKASAVSALAGGHRA